MRQAKSSTYLQQLVIDTHSLRFGVPWGSLRGQLARKGAAAGRLARNGGWTRVRRLQNIRNGLDIGASRAYA